MSWHFHLHCLKKLKIAALDHLMLVSKAVLIPAGRAAGRIEIIFCVCVEDQRVNTSLKSHLVVSQHNTSALLTFSSGRWLPMCLSMCSFMFSLVIVCEMVHHCFQSPNEVSDWKLTTEHCYITTCLLVNTTALVLIALDENTSKIQKNYKRDKQKQKQLSNDDKGMNRDWCTASLPICPRVLCCWTVKWVQRTNTFKYLRSVSSNLT